MKPHPLGGDLPRQVPTHADDPGAYENRKAIEKLRELDLPVFLAWGEEDAITRKAGELLRSIFRNVAPTYLAPGAGHFLQEEAGAEVAGKVVEWMAS